MGFKTEYQKEPFDFYFSSDKETLKIYQKTYKGIVYEISSNGSHPNSYILNRIVSFDKNEKNRKEREEKMKKERNWFVEKLDDFVHGGITYQDKYKIGWDYAHYGDFINTEKAKDETFHIWSFDELENEIKAAIDYLLEEKDFENVGF